MPHCTLEWPLFPGPWPLQPQGRDPATSLPMHRVYVEGTAVRWGDVPCSPEENMRKLAFSRENSTPLHGSGVCRVALQSACLLLQKSGQGHEEEAKSSLSHLWGKELCRRWKGEEARWGKDGRTPPPCAVPRREAASEHGCAPRCLSGAELVFKKHLLIRANPWLNGAVPEVTNIP